MMKEIFFGIAFVLCMASLLLLAFRRLDGFIGGTFVGLVFALLAML